MRPEWPNSSHFLLEPLYREQPGTTALSLCKFSGPSNRTPTATSPLDISSQWNHVSELFWSDTRTVSTGGAESGTDRDRDISKLLTVLAIIWLGSGLRSSVYHPITREDFARVVKKTIPPSPQPDPAKT